MSDGELSVEDENDEDLGVFLLFYCLRPITVRRLRELNRQGIHVALLVLHGIADAGVDTFSEMNVTFEQKLVISNDAAGLEFVVKDDQGVVAKLLFSDYLGKFVVKEVRADKLGRVCVDDSRLYWQPDGEKPLFGKKAIPALVAEVKRLRQIIEAAC